MKLSAVLFAAFALIPSVSLDATKPQTPPPLSVSCPNRDAVESARASLANSKGLLSTKVLTEALDSLEKHGCRPSIKAEIMVVDFALPSGTPRSWLVNVLTGAGQETPFIVAHGQGSDPNQEGKALRFGNVADSQMSSLGAFAGGRDAKTTAHPDAVVLYGLDGPLNDQAQPRFIYLHSTFKESPDYVSDEYIRGNDHKAGRSCGCFVVQRETFVKRMKPAVSNGGFIYAGYSARLAPSDRMYAGRKSTCGANVDKRSAKRR